MSGLFGKFYVCKIHSFGDYFPMTLKFTVCDFADSGALPTTQGILLYGAEAIFIICLPIFKCYDFENIVNRSAKSLNQRHLHYLCQTITHYLPTSEL